MIINKTKTLIDLGRIDISSIRSDILSIPKEMWDIETQRRENNFSCFHSTEHVLFKFHKSPTDPTQFVEKPLWHLWKHKLLPIIERSVKSYGYKNPVIPKAMLAKLLAKREIDKHIDAGPRNYKCHKIHIPIQTHPEVKFIIDDITYNLEEGHVYEVNNVVYHSVVNDSSIDRIHLVFEYFDNSMIDTGHSRPHS